MTCGDDVVPFSEMLDELEDFQSTYFEQNPAVSESECTKKLQEKAEQFVKLLKSPVSSDNQTTVALYHLNCGKLLNIAQEYDAKCEEHLSKAIKLDPDLHEPWLEYGALLAKKEKPNLEQIIFCYEVSLEKQPSAKCMAYLSVALRSLINANMPTLTPQQIKELRKRSMTYAEESVKTDPNSSLAHFCLGNALMIRFFVTQQNDPSLLTRAITSFRQGLECKKGERDPNIHLNLATSLKYEEQYHDAMHHLNIACKFDPCNSLGSINKRETLKKYLEKVFAIFDKKGKLKPKRLQSLCESLTSSEPSPFSTMRSSSSLLKPATSGLNSLSLGQNKGVYIVAKVIATVPHEEIVPLTMLIGDKSTTCMVVTVYNCTTNFGFIIGDTISIAEPNVLETKDLILDGSPDPISFRSIRGTSPAMISRNGVITKQIAHTTLSIASK
ncbi:hypothetical protein WR25_20273 [Diploscapter pachys]|uniref:Tetratricopeptide repeat protein 5 OB fold domain-containing protein n=1 Tax=Diploscapter pachys TaxID=2018661 RepID=A0A2A2LPD7_9BILA|nr:hypothetical protein WR25_20273 [Diploscapter pachys]